MRQLSTRRRLWLVLIGLVAAALLVNVPGAGAAPPTPPQPPQPVTVTNTPLQVQSAGDFNEVIIDQHKGVDASDPTFNRFIVDFGVHDLSPYKQIRILVVGDCDFAPPHDCAGPGHLTDTVDLELRAQMGDPTFARGEQWRSFHWMSGGDKGWVQTETLEVVGGLVNFRVHYFSGPVHLKVLGRRN